MTMTLATQAALLALLIAASLAQDSSIRVRSSVAFIIHGERTPLYGYMRPTLTPLGARQLYSQGSFFRDRYLVNDTSEDGAADVRRPIADISRDAIDNRQLATFSSDDGYNIASGLAFMQGLYPPNSQALLNVSDEASMDQLANGSLVSYPLDGYQYPRIRTFSVLDPSSIWVEGHTTCMNYWASTSELRAVAETSETYEATYEFYQNLWAKAFPGRASPFSDSEVSFANAYDLWDWASYQYNHNSTVSGSSIDANGTDEQPGLIRASEITQLRQLADLQQWGLNGNLTEVDPAMPIRTIAGRTLAGRVNAQFQSHVRSQGRTHKLSLTFGSFEPALAFFAISGLADDHGSGQFMQIPPPGSALVFELFSTSASGGSDSDVDEDDLWVRFLYRNGTGITTDLTDEEEQRPQFVEYPLFGRPNAETAMPWTDFYRRMDNIGVGDMPTWCELCDSTNIFCPDTSSSSSGSDTGHAKASGSLSPAVAGVVGAVVMLAALGLLAAGAWFIAGVRLARRGPRSDQDQKQRSGSIGGFKGAEKLDSDHDVLIARNGARHERIGSWEMGVGGDGGPGPMPPPPVANPSSPGGHVKSGAPGLGASIMRRDGDADSLSGKSPVKPHEGV